MLSHSFRVQVSFKFPRFHEEYAWEVRLSTMNTSGDFCRTCGFQFIDKKRKRNITGEFGIIFEAVFKETLSQDDTLPRAVCDKCRYQIEKTWLLSKQTEELSTENVSTKRKHPMSPLTSSAGDEQTVTRIERKKKGQRLVFDHKCPGQISVTDTSKEIIPAYVNILPSLPMQSAPRPVPLLSYNSELPSTLPPIMHDVATQTLKSNCLCGPVTKNSTCVKVSIISVLHENTLHKPF